MRIRKTHTHTLDPIPGAGSRQILSVCVCSLEFQAASAARSELSSLAVTLFLLHSLSLFPTHDPVLAPKIKQTMNFCVSWRKSLNFLCMQKEREREIETWRDLIGIAVFLTVNWFCAGQTVWQALLTTEISNNNGNHFPYKMQQQINSDNNNNYKKRASQYERTSERESCSDEMSKHWGVCCCNHLLHHTTQSRTEYNTHTNKQIRTHIAAVVVIAW